MADEKPSEEMISEWKKLYGETLPALARNHAPSQKSWPVHVDHCFGRIIMDNALGEGKLPWMEKVKAPAVKNMSSTQIQKCIDLGEKIVSGDENLNELNEISLRCRGKDKEGQKRKANADQDGGATSKRETNSKKPRKESSSTSPYFQTKLTKSSTTIDDQTKTTEHDQSQSPGETKSPADSEKSELREKILNSDLATLRKKVLLALLEIPAGKFTTYGALSKLLASSPRTVGQALKNNPYAPAVPCHRVLAAGGKIGGYGGEWEGRNGVVEGQGPKTKDKRALLRQEGVKFDVKGNAIGSEWTAWKASAVSLD